MHRVASTPQSVNGGVADMALDFLSRLNQCRAEQILTTPGAVSHPAPDTAAAHRRGLAAATSSLIACLHDVDGSWLERGLAYDVTRQVVLTYLDQIERSQQPGGVK